ncbi:FAD dependent oxidoreductase superfamily [Grosmannia clavigera kw1407]|uniref:FAD dependent oxidoreductase superfamily n=1 Tax=Grosmannia clavigera (strain kw1407 / UAMH 11150) TaxID=655863 RepID=F0XUM9_GROCL|nr:FAD dependent oxidoreductase superfamily [Grosmannia clavigera kw1407]EFW98760.1 FAD dependent oxidoreductase superfamily [Grosmannia clavigera kw1407]
MASTVIVGAGIVGITTAYFLSEHQPADTIHLVESSAFLASASGYAGGFLARDWFDPKVSELAALSFDQHDRLAAQYDGHSHWGYVASTSLDYELSPSAAGAQSRNTGPDLMGQVTGRPDEAASFTGGFPAWICRRDGDAVKPRGSSGTTAQVDPLAFSNFFLNVCRERGVNLHQPARVVTVGTNEDGELDSVDLQSTGGREGATLTTTLPCTRLIIAAGAWSGRVFDELFGGGARSPSCGIPTSSVSGHSLLLRPSSPPSVDVYAVFATGGSLDFHAVLFGRADGSVYVAGLNSTADPVSALSTDSVPFPNRLDHLLQCSKAILGVAAEDNVPIVRSGLCHRPVTPAKYDADPVRLASGARSRPVFSQPGCLGIRPRLQMWWCADVVLSKRVSGPPVNGCLCRTYQPKDRQDEKQKKKKQKKKNKATEIHAVLTPCWPPQRSQRPYRLFAGRREVVSHLQLQGKKYGVLKVGTRFHVTRRWKPTCQPITAHTLPPECPPVDRPQGREAQTHQTSGQWANEKPATGERTEGLATGVGACSDILPFIVPRTSRREEGVHAGTLYRGCTATALRGLALSSAVFQDVSQGAETARYNASDAFECVHTTNMHLITADRVTLAANLPIAV